MPLYEAVVHVLWELPFPLRLPPEAFFTWEPVEGIALFDPRPEVGELAWKRESQMLQATEVFVEVGPPYECYPTHNYLITSRLRSGREIKTAQLTRGPRGGFSEARPYTIANIFLCLRQREEYNTRAVLDRASDALNNILDVYRFITMDPLARPMRADQDCYYTLVSVADLPRDSGELDPKAVLLMIDSLSFGSILGENRVHHIGLNSLDDLLAGEVVPAETLRLFENLISAPQNLELFHQLILSAIRRLKRNEHALAVIDAQSAFESLVAVLVMENLKGQGLTPEQIKSEMSPRGRVHTLNCRLNELDCIATEQQKEAGIHQQQFLGSPEEVNWRRALYGLRNRIVHEGVRTVEFTDTKDALKAGLHAIHAIQDLTPAFNRPMIWTGDVLELGHIQQSAGRLSRLFEY